MACAHRARTQGELAALLADVLLRPVATPLTRLRDALVRPRGPALPVLLPAAGQPPLVLGRHPDCDVVLDDPTVSRRHLAVRPAEDGWIARDLGSRNGSWLGEARLGRARVVPGDELVLGETLVRLA